MCLCVCSGEGVVLHCLSSDVNLRDHVTNNDLHYLSPSLPSEEFEIG